jgi:hypothetical protein
MLQKFLAIWQWYLAALHTTEVLSLVINIKKFKEQRQLQLAV